MKIDSKRLNYAFDYAFFQSILFTVVLTLVNGKSFGFSKHLLFYIISLFIVLLFFNVIVGYIKYPSMIKKLEIRKNLFPETELHCFECKSLIKGKY